LPVSGALVETTDPAGFIKFSNGTGHYSITAAPGTYNVRASKDGFGQATGIVTVTNGGNAILNLCLQPTPVIVSGGATIVSESCSPANGAIDPGETVTVSLCVSNTGSATANNLVGILQATGGIVGPSGPQNYGMVVAGGGTVCRNFTFTADGSCGGTITASLQLQDGATDLGTVTYTFTLGVLDVAFAENFDGVTTPNLPAGWTAVTNSVPPNPGGDNCPANGGSSTPWATNTTTPDTAPNSAFTNDPACISDELLVSPLIAIETAAAALTFRHNFILEDGFDGGVLEISIGGGGFTDILAAGGTFAQNGYTGMINTTFDSPIAGRMAWEGNSAGYVTTRVNLPASAMGQNIQLRFRRATDESVSSTGWRVDTINITDGFDCCSGGGTPNIVAGPATLVNESCPPDNNAIDPGERVTVNLTLMNNGTAGATNVVATLIQGGGVTAPSDPQSYGALAPTASAARDFSFTAVGSCGGSFTATWNLNDGPNNLGTVTKTFTLGCTTPCGIVRLVVTSTLERTNGTTVKATYIINNTGTAQANNVQLTTARLGSTNGAPLAFIGNIPANNQSPPFEVFFTNSTPGASSTLALGGAYTGGTFSSTKRVTIP
jgi:hypothetical protein